MLWHRGVSPPHCLSKVKTLNPKVLLADGGPKLFLFGPCCPFILAFCGALLWFCSHFGLLGLLSFALALWAFISFHFGLVGLHFLAFWPCGPSFPCILALWAFISLHFGLVGLHFLAFWPCGSLFPCILPFSGSASGPPPPMLPKMARLPNALTMDLSAR